jgi:hypothetical protein
MPIFYDRATMPPIVPDLIPFSSWGSSLANLLTSDSWAEIRRPLLQKTGSKCQLCGTRPTRRSPDCHEVWAYSEPPGWASERQVGVQRLIGIVAVCELCHEMFHLGLARVRGRDGIAGDRLRAFNQWSGQELAVYNKASSNLGFRRSRRRWLLDLSLVTLGGFSLTVNSRRWTLHEGSELTSIHRDTQGDAWTAMVGASYLFNGQMQPPIGPLDQAYADLLPEDGDYELIRSLGNGVTEDGLIPCPFDGADEEDDDDYSMPDPDVERQQKEHWLRVNSGEESGCAIRLVSADEAKNHIRELMAGSAGSAAFLAEMTPPTIPSEPKLKAKRTFRQTVRSVITALYG